MDVSVGGATPGEVVLGAVRKNSEQVIWEQAGKRTPPRPLPRCLLPGWFYADLFVPFHACHPSSAEHGRIMPDWWWLPGCLLLPLAGPSAF